MDETEDDYRIQNKSVLQRKKMHFLSIVKSEKGKKNTKTMRQLLV